MLYELTLFGRYFGQQTVNRFNYLSTATPASVLGSFALTSAFGMIYGGGGVDTDTVFGRIISLVSAAWTAETAQVRACADYDVEDFYERPFVPPVAGISTGDGQSPTAAYGFRSSRVRLDIDRGTKRFAGVTDTVSLNGGTLDTGAGTALALLAAAMTDIIEYDDEGTPIPFSPCIVQKEEYTTPSGKRAYKYYPTLVEQMEHIAVGIIWQPYSTVRTQDSRQYGRGS